MLKDLNSLEDTSKRQSHSQRDRSRFEFLVLNFLAKLDCAEQGFAGCRKPALAKIGCLPAGTNFF